MDDPEAFISNLPSEAKLAKDRLRRAGFKYSPDFLSALHDDASCAAWYKAVDIDFLGYGTRAYAVLHVELPHYVVGMTDVEHRWMATYDQITSNRTEAVSTLLELVAKVERHEVEVRNHQFYTVNETIKSKHVVTNMSKLSEGGHKAGCKCGFCANKGKFGKKADDTGADKDKDKSKESKAESLIKRKVNIPRPRSESQRASKIVSKLLDD